MKKIGIILALVICTITSQAQDKQFVSLLLNYPNNLQKAKEDIDKIMNDAKNQNKAEGWLWKTRVYAEIYFNETMRSSYPQAGNIAFESFKKYESLEPSYKMLEEAASWRPLDLIYVTGFNLGRKFFEEKQWDSSFHYFTAAAYMGSIIVKKDLRKNGAILDTLSVVYCGYAAQNAKKEEEAVKYYDKLINIRVNTEEYKDVYTYVLIHYANLKDAENFNKYLSISKETYPKAEWDDFEFDFLSKAYNAQQREEYYDKQDATGTLSARKYLLFGQMFTEILKDEKSSIDSAKNAHYNKKSASAFMKAFDKDNTLGIAAFNVGVIYYNEYGMYDDAYRANIKKLQELNINKPIEKDPKKKLAADAKFKADVDAIKKINQEVETQTLATVDIAINWLEKSYQSLNALVKKDKVVHSCLNITVDRLADLYQYKREKVKGKDMKLYDAYDAKYKQYDELHGKL